MAPTNMSAVEAKIFENIEEINKIQGYDVTIVCCSTEHQANYWQDRLTKTKGQIAPADGYVVAVHEDWEGGAGNGLGTLYAYQKAAAKVKDLFNLDINEKLADASMSVALFHTAGKGTRLAPLPGGENNNKPGVKLPGLLQSSNNGTEEGNVQMTILESVIKQTGAYAASRKGRLSVFWGDQIFVPSVSCKYDSKHHIDILASLAPMPTEEEWKERGLESYGLIAVDVNQDAAQVEKVTYNQAQEFLKDALDEVAHVGSSLGSFSVDSEMLQALLGEFTSELAAKKGKLDTDPHFWMPFTLKKDSYVKLMASKGVDENESSSHHDRMAAMLKRFNAEKKTNKGLFGCVDVGSDAYWWDYGKLRLYIRNNIRLTEDDVEADAMRKFLGASEEVVHSNIGNAKLSGGSRALGCDIKDGSIDSSVVCGVSVQSIDVKDSILMNVTAKSIKAKDCVLYNVSCDDVNGLDLADGTVLVGVYLPDGKKVTLESHVDICGGKTWKEALPQNDHSWEDIYHLNADANVIDIQKIAEQDHSSVKKSVFA